MWPDMPPALLVTFDPADWPAEDDREAFDQWRDARKAFFEVHGWPGGAVAMIQQHVQADSRYFFGRP